MESKHKFVKAKFKDAKKIISFTESFEGFLKSLETSFKISLYPLESSSFSIAYLDDEEDLINIENPFDYQEALKFAENSNQNFLNFLISHKNQSFANLPFKKDNKETFEFIENNSLRSQELQKSPQIEFLIPKGQKADLNTIQKLEDLKFYVDENQINIMSKKLRSKKNFRNEDTILSKSPEISIDLPKQLIDRNTQENFEITYDSSNNSQKKDKNKEKAMKSSLQSNEVRNETNFKLEKNPKKKSEKKTEKKKEKENEDESQEPKEILSSEKNKIFNCIKLNSEKKSKESKENKEIKKKEIKKQAKTIAKTIAKKAINEELRFFKKEVEAEITAVISKHYGNLLQKNFEAQKKLSEMQHNISKLNTLSKVLDLNLNGKKAHLGFACRSCKQEPLVGIRYKCSVCKDFDICEACEETSTQEHPHPFIKIRTPELNPAFIKTILFEDNNNNFNDSWSNNNNVNNAQDKERYIEKYIDLDYNSAFSGNNNNNLNSYNCFNLEANNQMLNYLKNSGLNNLLNSNMINNNTNNTNNNNNNNTNNHNISNCSSANSNFNINNLFKPSNFTNFMSNNNNNLHKNPSTTEDKYQITCLNASEVFEIKNSKSKEFKVSLKLKNSGRCTIPRHCYLECVSSLSEISGKGIPIDLSLKPGISVNLEVTLDIAGLRKGMYLSVWRMQTSQREFFGEEIALKIKIEKTEDLKIKENYVEKNLNTEINNTNEKISLSELLRRNKISENDLPLKSQKSFNSNINNSVNSSSSSQQQSKIISLEEFKKLKLLKHKKSESNNAEKAESNNIRPVQKETKDFFALADEIIKKHPHMNINRKLLVNALFRTGGNEKNSIEMATNESHNVCGHYNKHKFN